MSKVFYRALGADLDRAFQDGTHHNNYGSYELAKCVVAGIQQAKLPLAGGSRTNSRSSTRRIRMTRRRSGCQRAPAFGGKALGKLGMGNTFSRLSFAFCFLICLALSSAGTADTMDSARIL